jgi:catechol 2,3-dioxygenase-like lactoylglutathione lyase family enzyme
VSDGRTVASLVLVILSVFVFCASTGAQSWVMAALGVALAAAGIGLYLVSALNSREFAYVPGTAHVQSCSPPPASAAHGRCEMHLIVHAPGMDDVAVKIRDTGVPVSKWPNEGSTLPILVALGDRRRVRVLWDQIRSHGEAAEERGDDEYDEGTEEGVYLDGLLDGDYPAEPVPDIDPTARVLEMEIFTSGGDNTVPDDEPDESLAEVPGAGVPGDQESAGIALATDAGESRQVEFSVAAQEAGAGAPGTVTDGEIAAPAGARPPSPARNEPTRNEPTRNEPRRKPSPRPRRPVDDELAEAASVITASVITAEPPTGPRSGEPADSGDRARRLAITAGPVDTRSGTRNRSTTAPAPRSEPRPEPAEPPPAGPLEDLEPTHPLRVDQVLTAEPAVPAIPSSSVVGDLAEEGTISEAYLTILPPPGETGPVGTGRVRDVGVTMFVANLGRSVAFYRDLLGFVQVDIGRDSAVLESGDGRIVLRRVMDMSPVDRRLVHLMLEVPDVQSAYDELREKGVEFVHRPRAVSRYEQLELWSAAFRDPDGHGIALIRWELRR